MLSTHLMLSMYILSQLSKTVRSLPNVGSVECKYAISMQLHDLSYSFTYWLSEQITVK